MIDHKFKKKFGQNFLFDDNILKKIYGTISPNEDDLIIEIGPGSGNLTSYLKGYNSQLICFEIDTSLKDKLDKFIDDKTHIYYEDFMGVSLDSILDKYTYNNLYVIANIPYYITTPIIEKITFSKCDVKSMILMVQKEVAYRLSSLPGNREYGYITAFLNCFYDIKVLFNVSRNSFYPVPNVDSAVIKLDRNFREIVNIEKLNKFLMDAFKFKRKNLKNNLNGYKLDVVEMVLSEYGYSLSNRAEDIPVDVFIKITDLL